MSRYLSETQHDGEEKVNTEKLEVEVEELVWRKVEDADPSAKDTEHNETYDWVNLFSPLGFFYTFITFTFPLPIRGKYEKACGG